MAISLPVPAVEAPIYVTADLVDALNEALDDHRPAEDILHYECVDGELLVTRGIPRPWHTALVDRLFRALVRYSDGEPAAGYVSTQPLRFTFGRADVNVRPDVWAVSTSYWRAQNWEVPTTPLLLAEVLSPSTQRNDRFPKRGAYMRAGVPLYWIVDGDRRHVEVWTPGVDFPQFERDRLTWQPEGAAEPFALDLAELFAPV